MGEDAGTVVRSWGGMPEPLGAHGGVCRNFWGLWKDMLEPLWAWGGVCGNFWGLSEGYAGTFGASRGGYAGTFAGLEVGMPELLWV